jgi:predicted dithiol-disulfide oxidoreductase (DUF899 family)
VHVDHRRDRLRGPHITQRIDFAVVARAPIDRFRAHADSRGWRHARLLSSAHTTCNRDYQAETPDGGQVAMATVFVRRAGQIRHTWSTELRLVPSDPGQDHRHVDFMWPLWGILDRTRRAEGPTAGDQHSYPGPIKTLDSPHLRVRRHLAQQ